MVGDVPYLAKEIFLAYAWSLLHVAYQWGGNNYVHNSTNEKEFGLDCSGYVLTCLRAVEPDLPDMTSQGLYNFYVRDGNQIGFSSCNPKRGALLFFGKSKDKITHVSIALSRYIHIESGGGNSSCVTIEEARRRGAMVRVRPIRKDLIACAEIF